MYFITEVNLRHDALSAWIYTIIVSTNLIYLSMIITTTRDVLGQMTNFPGGMILTGWAISIPVYYMSSYSASAKSISHQYYVSSD